MVILTSTHGWTDNSDINVKVYAVNTDGVSDAATQGLGSTIKYQYVPTTAPAIVPDASSITASQVNITLTCLDPDELGYFDGTTSYFLEYKLSTSTTWSAPVTITTCGTEQTISSLSAVSTYQFRAYASHDIGTGPTTSSGNYETVVTYGPSSTPERLVITQNNNKTITLAWK